MPGDSTLAHRRLAHSRRTHPTRPPTARARASASACIFFRVVHLPTASCALCSCCAQLMLGAAGVAGVARADVESDLHARLAHRSERTFPSDLTARQEPCEGRRRNPHTCA